MESVEHSVKSDKPDRAERRMSREEAEAILTAFDDGLYDGTVEQYQRWGRDVVGREVIVHA